MKITVREIVGRTIAPMRTAHRDAGCVAYVHEHRLKGGDSSMESLLLSNSRGAPDHIEGSGWIR